MEEQENRNIIQWYERDFTLEDAMGMIQGSMKSAVRNYVAVGFYLKAIRDRKLFEEAGYRNFEEFVRDKYDKDKGWASKCIKVNDRLSKDGNSPLLGDEYKDYNVSQLVELAAMTEEQRAQVTPETSVREMKQIRNPKPEESEKVVTLQLPEKTINHFTDGDRSIDNAYGATISKIVKAYLAKGLVQECMVMAWGDTYKVLRRSDVTVFYTDKGETLFDVENSRLEKEYQYWYGSKSVADQEQEDSLVQEAGVAISQQQETDKEEPELMIQKVNEQPLSAYGTPELVYPEDSLIAMKGCEGGHGCFSCHLECNIRQEECCCVEAPIGNPFPCTTMDVIGNLRAEIGSHCQFINLELAYHRTGDNEPVPCCKKCNEMCGYRCGRAIQPEQGEQDAEVIDTEFSEVDDPQDKDPTDLEIARQELERANNLLIKCLSDLPDENNVHIRGMKLKVAALASLVQDLDDVENPPPKPEQPELPILRNSDQRKEWLENFRSWPVWFEVPEASEVYYRYDLPDGNSIVICEYRRWVEWMEKYVNENPDKAGEREYLLKPGYHYLHDCLTNRMMLVEKLKEIQKKN